MSSQVERTLVRMLMGAAFCAALFVAAIAPADVLPAVAFGQVPLYRLEVALLVFYGVLLLVTPAFLGLTRGGLPIEISTRGAKFAEGASQSAALNEQKIEELERTTEDQAVKLATLDFEIEQLRQMKCDSSQPRLDSKR